MRYVLSIGLMLSLSIAVHGQQTGVDPRVATPGESQPDTSGQRLQQLRRAASDLEWAGNREKAAVVRHEAEQEEAALLRRLDTLQAEVERIRQGLVPRPQVLLHLQILEVSLSKLEKLGFDFQKLAEGFGPAISPVGPDRTSGKSQVVTVVNDVRGIHGSATVAKEGEILNLVDDGTAFLELLVALRQDKLAKVVAEPTLVTVSGRAASFRVGGELPAVKQPDGSMSVRRPYGTAVDWAPEVVGDRVRMTIRGQVAEVVPGQPARVGQEALPGVHCVEFNSRMEVGNGETVVLGGMNTKRARLRPSGASPAVGESPRSVEETPEVIATFFVIRTEIEPQGNLSALPGVMPTPATNIH